MRTKNEISHIILGKGSAATLTLRATRTGSDDWSWRACYRQLAKEKGITKACRVRGEELKHSRETSDTVYHTDRRRE